MSALCRHRQPRKAYCPECERLRLSPPLAHYEVHRQGAVLRVVREYPRYRVTSFVPTGGNHVVAMYRAVRQLDEEQRRSR